MERIDWEELLMGGGELERVECTVDDSAVVP
jgi:hypothetical protein